jgi:hypothetical protein
MRLLSIVYKEAAFVRFNNRDIYSKLKIGGTEWESNPPDLAYCGVHQLVKSTCNFPVISRGLGSLMIVL